MSLVTDMLTLLYYLTILAGVIGGPIVMAYFLWPHHPLAVFIYIIVFILTQLLGANIPKKKERVTCPSS